MTDTLLHFAEAHYHLHAWCVMPNHVHAVLTPLPEYPLSGILHSWKSFSSKQANKRLGRTGAFWQAEYYDHLIRNEKDLHGQINYVHENPQKAGLHTWKWVSNK